MIVMRSEHPSWLSNSYLVADEEGGHGVLIDTGGPVESLLGEIRAKEITITHILNTHHHGDHVSNNALCRQRLGAEIYAHPWEKERIAGCSGVLHDGDTLSSGALSLRVLHIPGHTEGQLAFWVEGVGCFTGDTLFAGSLGGTCVPGHSTFADIRHSVIERLMKLPHDTPVYPGHEAGSTIGREGEENSFIRAFRGVDATLDEPCQAFGRPALLRVLTTDYDGDNTAWVTFDHSQQDDIVPGSQLRLLR